MNVCGSCSRHAQNNYHGRHVIILEVAADIDKDIQL